MAVLWAAVLRAGDGAMLSYQTAAELSGLIDQASSVIHVTVPRTRRVTKISGIAVHIAARAQQARHPRACSAEDADRGDGTRSRADRDHGGGRLCLGDPRSGAQAHDTVTAARRARLEDASALAF
jgi:hypothetical protein